MTNISRIQLALLFFALSASAAAIAADPTPDQREQIKLLSNKWSERRQATDAAIASKKFAQAESLIKQTLDERKALQLDLLSEYDQLGALYQKWGKKSDAEAAFKTMVEAREAMSLTSDDPLLFYPLSQYANCLEANGKRDQAKKLRNRAAAVQREGQTLPKFGPVKGIAGSAERKAEAEEMRLLGEKYIKCDLQSKAVAYFNRAVQLDPDNAIAWYDRGDANAWFNKTAAAQADYSKAIKLKPDYARAYAGRGYVFMNTKQYPKALAEFAKAAQMDPKDTESRGARAKLLDTLGKHDEAVKEYTQVIAADPTLYWPYIQRAEAYKAMNKYQEAIADYTTLVNRAPTDSDFHEYRGAAYLKSGNLKSALEDFNQVIALNPKYSLGYHERAKIYEKLDGKKTPRVLADYAQAKKLGYSR